MPAVLIADAYKASLVMTSEIFKDKVPGITVAIANSGQECVDLAEKNSFDMIVVDFDLPDADGVSLVKLLRQTYDGPILLTAYPEKMVSEAIDSELYAYEDVSSWVKKPIKVDQLCEKIEMFLLEKQRFLRRFKTNLQAQLVATKNKRGKIKGNVINVGLGGVLLKCPDKPKLKTGDEVVLTCDFSVADKTKSSKTSGKGKNAEASKEKPSQLKAEIAWTSKNKERVGLKFKNLNDDDLKKLNLLFRTAKPE